MKCCANCEFCISPEEENEIMEEQGYDETDPLRPHAGDCCLSKDHGKNFVCESHSFRSGLEEYNTYCFYDEKFFGKGYLIVQELEEEITKFIKISTINEYGFPHFVIRGFDKDLVEDGKKDYIEIRLTVTESDNAKLYNSICSICSRINNQKLSSIDSENEGKNYVSFINFGNEVAINMVKDVYGVKHTTDYIDVNIGDNDTCKYYEEFLNFYKSLELSTIKETNDQIIKKILNIKN